MSSPTTSPTSTPTASRPTSRCSRNISTRARMRTISAGTDRRVSYVQDRGTFRDFSQGAVQQTSNPLDVAIGGDGFLAVQTAGGERYTRDGNLQINSTGQLVTAARQSRARHRRPDRVPADRPRHRRSRRRHRHGAGRRQPHRFDPRQAAHRQLHRRAEADQAGQQPLFRGERRGRSRTPSRRCSRASSRSRTSIRSSR